jgi:hypothetical protein
MRDIDDPDGDHGVDQAGPQDGGNKKTVPKTFLICDSFLVVIRILLPHSRGFAKLAIRGAEIF